MYINVSLDTRPLVKDLTNLENKLERNINAANKAAALLVQGQARANISRGSRGGRFYRRRGVVHQASKAGEYPKSDTGRLVSSISVETDNMAAYVGSNLQYAAYLENGTRYIQGRSWLYRTYRENIDKIEKLYNDAIRDAIK